MLQSSLHQIVLQNSQIAEFANWVHILDALNNHLHLNTRTFAKYDAGTLVDGLHKVAHCNSVSP